MPRKQTTRVDGRGWRLNVGILALVLFFGGALVVQAQAADPAIDFWKAVVERVSDKLAAGFSINGPVAPSEVVVAPPAPVAGAGDSSVMIEDNSVSSDPEVFGAATDVRNTGLSPTGNCTSNKSIDGSITVSDCLYSGTISAASSTFMDLVIRQGGPYLVKEAWIQLDSASVSSTTRFSMGTSTIATAPNFDAAAGAIKRGILDQLSVATSTPYPILDRGWMQTSAGVTGLATSSTLQRVSNGDHIVGFMTTGGSNIIQGSSVTSTDGRGFTANSRWYVLLRRMSTSTK